MLVAEGGTGTWRPASITRPSEELVVRQAHPVDSTMTFVEVTDAGREALDRYLGSILQL